MNGIAVKSHNRLNIEYLFKLKVDTSLVLTCLTLPYVTLRYISLPYVTLCFLTLLPIRANMSFFQCISERTCVDRMRDFT